MLIADLHCYGHHSGMGRDPTDRTAPDLLTTSSASASPAPKAALIAISRSRLHVPWVVVRHFNHTVPFCSRQAKAVNSFRYRSRCEIGSSREPQSLALRIEPRTKYRGVEWVLEAIADELCIIVFDDIFLEAKR